MSFLKPFLDAFKKASAPKSPDAVEEARSSGHLGPTTGDAAGSFEPLRPAPGTPTGGGSAIPNIGGTKAPIQDVTPIVRPPSQPPTPGQPGEQGPIEGGGGGGTPTPPSAPFEPVTVRFREAGAGVAEDPDAGGEVSEAGKTDLDEGFIQRLRLVDDGSTVIDGGDPPESTEYSGETTRQGTPLVQVGSGGDGSEGGGGSGPHPPGPGTGGSEGEPELISFVDRRGGATQPSNPLKGEGGRPTLQSSDPEEGGEVTERFRTPTGLKAEGVLPTLQSSDPEEGGEVSERFRPPTGLKAEGVLPTLQSSDPEEGGEVSPGEMLRRRVGGDDLFKVKMEEVLVSSPSGPAAPGGSPIPYPLAEGSTGDGGAEAPALGKMKIPHKIEDAPGSSSSANQAVVSDGEGSGAADSLARKAGEGQKDFLKVGTQETVASRQASGGVAGESTDRDHKLAETVGGSRAEVKDSHDRFASTRADTPSKPAAPLMDDDDLESSTLLDLKPAPAVKEMLPGLASQVPGDLAAGIHPDLDADSDMDASEL